MVKWADFGISAVRYNEERTNIEKVFIHEDKGETIGPGATKTRRLIVREIKDGKRYATILKTNKGEWEKGQDVNIIEVNNEEYLRTDVNETGADNLENLPEF